MDKSAFDKMTDGAFDAIMGRLAEHGSMLGRDEKLVLRVEVREGGAHLEMSLSELGEEGRVHQARAEHVDFSREG